MGKGTQEKKQISKSLVKLSITGAVQQHASQITYFIICLQVLCMVLAFAIKCKVNRNY